MKNKFKTPFYLLITLSLIFSCTIEKRIYKKGYFVQWNSHFPKKSVDKINENNENYLISENEIETNFLEHFQNENLNAISEINSNDDAILTKENSIPEISTNKNYKFKNTETKKDESEKNYQKIEINQEQEFARMDGELALNITLTVLFAGLTVLFIFLALAAIVPMIYVWWGLALVSFILFVTQVIDLIMW
jgi:hypothetical protein